MGKIKNILANPAVKEVLNKISNSSIAQDTKKLVDATKSAVNLGTKISAIAGAVHGIRESLPKEITNEQINQSNGIMPNTDEAIKKIGSIFYNTIVGISKNTISKAQNGADPTNYNDMNHHRSIIDRVALMTGNNTFAGIAAAFSHLLVTEIPRKIPEGIYNASKNLTEALIEDAMNQISKVKTPKPTAALKPKETPNGKNDGKTPQR